MMMARWTALSAPRLARRASTSIAAAPLHCDPSSARPRWGAWKAPIIAAFSWPPRAISIRLELNCSSAQHSAMPRSGNCATRQQEIGKGEIGRQADQDQDSSPPAFPSPLGPAWIGLAFSATAAGCSRRELVSQPLVFPHRSIAGNPRRVKRVVRSFLFFPGLALPGSTTTTTCRAAPRPLCNCDACVLVCSARQPRNLQLAARRLVAPAMGMCVYVSGNRRGVRLFNSPVRRRSFALVFVRDRRPALSATKARPGSARSALAARASGSGLWTHGVRGLARRGAGAGAGSGGSGGHASPSWTASSSRRALMRTIRRWHVGGCCHPGAVVPL
jgi:hypothetical protein